MLIQEVGPDWYPGQALFEAFTPSWSTSQAFNMEYIPRTGGSSVGSITDALVSLGFQQYSSILSLDAVHALLFSQPVPSQPRWKSVDNSSQETTLALTRNHNTYQTRQFYGDLAGIEVPHNFRLTRQHITQNFDSGILVDNVARSKIELAGMYMIDAGDGQTVKIGPTNRRPIISLVGDVTQGVQVGDTWTEAANGGVSAQDADGNALTVVTTGTVDTSILGISTLTYTAVSSQGDIAEVKQRFIVATDTTAPALSLTGGNISLTQGDTWTGEPGYSSLDNLDGDVSHLGQITGWDGETGVVGQFQRDYSVQDSQGNVASTFRTISIEPPFTWQTGAIYGYGSGNPTGASPQYVSHTIQPSAWRGPSAAQCQDVDLVFERAYASHSAGNATLGLGPNTLSAAFDGIVYDLGAQHYTRMVIEGFTFQGQILDSGSNRLALYLKGAQSATGPWTVIAYQQSSYWPGLLNPPQTFSYNHPAKQIVPTNTTAYRYLAIGYGVVSGSLSTNTPDSGISRVCLTGDFYA